MFHCQDDSSLEGALLLGVACFSRVMQWLCFPSGVGGYVPRGWSVVPPMCYICRCVSVGSELRILCVNLVCSAPAACGCWSVPAHLRSGAGRRFRRHVGHSGQFWWMLTSVILVLEIQTAISGVILDCRGMVVAFPIYVFSCWLLPQS